MASSAVRRVVHQLTKRTLTNCSNKCTQFYSSNRTNAVAFRYFHASQRVCVERRFTDKHEWIMLDGKTGVIGITDYAQEALGDVVFAQLPEIGAEFDAMDECGALESVKAASELYCPVSGRVTEKNVDVEEKPALVNSSCYDKGWLFIVKLTKPEELDSLMTESQYKKFLTDQMIN